jgi:hypothetical protein
METLSGNLFFSREKKRNSKFEAPNFLLLKAPAYRRQTKFNVQRKTIALSFQP